MIKTSNDALIVEQLRRLKTRVDEAATLLETTQLQNRLYNSNDYVQSANAEGLANYIAGLKQIVDSYLDLYDGKSTVSQTAPKIRSGWVTAASGLRALQANPGEALLSFKSLSDDEASKVDRLFGKELSIVTQAIRNLVSTDPRLSSAFKPLLSLTGNAPSISTYRPNWFQGLIYSPGIYAEGDVARAAKNVWEQVPFATPRLPTPPTGDLVSVVAQLLRPRQTEIVPRYRPISPVDLMPLMPAPNAPVPQNPFEPFIFP